MKRHLAGRRIRQLTLAALAAGSLTMFPFAGKAAPEQYEIDPEHFSIGFMAMHLGYDNVLGMFLEGEGSFTFDEEAQQVSEIRIEIEADSVFTNHKRRDRHLRSPDFLNAREFPKIIFIGVSAEKTGDNTGIIRGNLELLGQSRPIDLEITLNKAEVYPILHEKYTLGISARATFQRSEYGMTYAVSDGLVGDQVDLILEFEAIRQ